MAGTAPVDAAVAGFASADAAAGGVAEDGAVMVEGEDIAAAGVGSAWAGAIAVTPSAAVTATDVTAVIVRNRVLCREEVTRAPLCVPP